MPHQNPSLSLPPPAFTALEKARWYIRAQNTRAALTCLNQLLATTDPPADTATQLSAHLGCQYAYALLGHWAAAVVELQAARGLHPQRCMVYAGGQLYWRLTRSPEAEEDFNHLAARDRANLTDREPPPPSELACLTPWEILTALQFPLVLPA